jgi:hypothetical protein
MRHPPQNLNFIPIAKAFTPPASASLSFRSIVIPPD